jgi:putative membrane protein
MSVMEPSFARRAILPKNDRIASLFLDSPEPDGVSNRPMKEIGLNLVRGAMIGVANIIPGVSGGTVALVLGVFERLVRAIRNLDSRLVRSSFRLLAGGFKGLPLNNFIADLRRADVFFMGTLGVGAAVAIVLLSRVMEYLLTGLHDPTYAFFDGLILASLVVPWRLLQKKGVPEIASFAVGLGFILVLSVGFGHLADRKLEIKAAQQESAAALEEGEDAGDGYERVRDPVALGVLFTTGVVAISAMILPGVSGSFIMLVMGQYEKVLTAINNRDLVVLGVVALGCIIGLLAFTRLLNFLLRRFHSQTIAFLIGLMIGSFWTLWPFKATIVVAGETHFSTQNVLPAVDANLFVSLATFAVGFAIVAAFDVVERRLRST